MPALRMVGRLGDYGAISRDGFGPVSVLMVPERGLEKLGNLHGVGRPLLWRAGAAARGCLPHRTCRAAPAPPMVEEAARLVDPFHRCRHPSAADSLAGR